MSAIFARSRVSPDPTNTVRNLQSPICRRPSPRPDNGKNGCAPRRGAQAFETRLALRELEAAARLWMAVLLALDDAGIAREKAARLQGYAQPRFISDQGAADAVPHGAGLS